MGHKARFVYGSETFDISSPYSLGEDFAPPATQRSVNWAGGTSANVSGGAKRISDKALDRGWSFTVRIDAGSIAETHSLASRLGSFMAKCRDKREKLYFEYWASDAVPYVPLWGEGGPLRYEVKDAALPLDQQWYGGSHTIEKRLVCMATLTVAPYAEGSRMRLCSAVGGILEDTIGTPDGTSRGLIIPEATTNKITNPVFGNATYSTGWTATANLIVTQNTDPAFVYPGCVNSAKITSTNNAIDNIYTQSINAGAAKHTLTAWVVKPDRSAVTSSDCVLYYDAGPLATTFTHLGNGIYQAQAANFDAAAAIKVFGLQVKAARTVYLMAAQLEQKAYGTPLAYGDLLGCAWTGTAHASTSTRTAARVKIASANSIDIASGSVHIVWKARYANTHPNVQVFFDARTVANVSLYGYFNAADDKYYLSDGTNTILSAAQTFSAGDILDLVFTWGAAGLNIYKNGSNVATGATYTPTATGTDLYIGTSYVVDYHCGGTLLGFETYNRALSATEIAADYANLYEQITSGDGLGVRLSAVPWEWDKDGDGILDAYWDATHSERCVVGGIPGSAEAETLLTLTASADGLGYILANNPHHYYLPTGEWIDFKDIGGTVAAGALGGEVNDASTITTSTALIDAVHGVQIYITSKQDGYLNKRAYLYASLSDVGTGLQSGIAVFAGGQLMYSDFVDLAADATRRQFIIGYVDLPTDANINYSWSGKPDIVIVFRMKRSSGSAKVAIDFMRPLWGQVIYFDVYDLTRQVVIFGKNSDGYDSTGDLYQRNKSGIGEPIQFIPGQYNHLVALAGDPARATDLTATITITRMDVTPRYELL